MNLENIAGGTASNAASSAVNGMGGLTPKVSSLGSSGSITQNPSSSNPNTQNSAPKNSNSNLVDTQNKGDIKENDVDKAENTESNSKVNQNQRQKDENAYQARTNEKFAPGKKIDENGNVVNTGTRKSVEAIGRGVAAYASGGKSIGNEDIITKNPIGDKALGVVADTADKVPIAGSVLNELGESGLADGVNDALDTVGKAKNGDIKGSLDSAKKTKEDLTKVIKKSAKRIALIVFGVIFSLIVVCVVIIAVCGPVLGGFMDVTKAFADTVGDIGDFFSGENSIEGLGNSHILKESIKDTEGLLSEVPNYDSLNETNKGILTAAAAGVSSGKPYHIHSGDDDPCFGKPTGPGIDGIPACGIDCSGFVQWAIWTATNNKPFSGGTSTISSSIGGIFEEISESELQPGDIGLKHKGSGNNHTGIYAGNGFWYHAAGTNSGIIRSKYTGFTVYLRYKGSDKS